MEHVIITLSVAKPLFARISFIFFTRAYPYSQGGAERVKMLPFIKFDSSALNEIEKSLTKVQRTKP